MVEISAGKSDFPEGNQPLSDFFCTMKKTFYFILIGLFSCQTEKKPDEVSLEDPSEYTEWMVYEGRIPLNENSHLYIEVSMLPGEPNGEGSYRLEEFIETENTYTPASSFNGKYSTLYGDFPAEMVLHFINSAQPEGVTRTYVTPGFQGNISHSQLKMIREESFRKTDLVLQVESKNKLVVLDQHLEPVSVDPVYKLTRRTSRLFTVEGYFRHNGDTVDFFEMNTRERWAVSKLGDYHQAIRQYHKLVKEKFEVTYIKATGYSIRHINREGSEIEALVFKRVLQMTSSPSLTEEYTLFIK